MKIATWSASCVVSELNSRFMSESSENKFGGILISPPSGMDAKYIRGHRGMHLPCAPSARPVPILVTQDEIGRARQYRASRNSVLASRLRVTLLTATSCNQAVNGVEKYPAGNTGLRVPRQEERDEKARNADTCVIGRGARVRATQGRAQVRQSIRSKDERHRRRGERGARQLLHRKVHSPHAAHRQRSRRDPSCA